MSARKKSTPRSRSKKAAKKKKKKRSPVARRVSTQARSTAETEIEVKLAFDTPMPALPEIDVPDGFFAHMLDALGRHSGMELEVSTRGDTHIDLHHTVEDTGIVLGDALHEALGTRRGIRRFASAYAPLDEALARAVVDLSGRGYLVHELPREIALSWVTRDFPMTLVEDFFQAFADRGRFTLHLDVLRARNPHHAAEACFKAAALALKEATAIAATGAGIPSTKGTLTS